MATRKLFVLSSTRRIDRELDKRFANAYPEFDPAVHHHPDATQSDSEKAGHVRQRSNQFKSVLAAATAPRDQNGRRCRRRDSAQALTTHRTTCNEAVEWVNQKKN